MRDLYSRAQPIAIRKWTDDVQRLEPIRTLAIVTRGDYPRPIGPVDTQAIKRELGTTIAPGPPLNLRPRRRSTWRQTLAHLLRLHP